MIRVGLPGIVVAHPTWVNNSCSAGLRAAPAGTTEVKYGSVVVLQPKWFFPFEVNFIVPLTPNSGAVKVAVQVVRSEEPTKLPTFPQVPVTF